MINYTINLALRPNFDRSCFTAFGRFAISVAGETPTLKISELQYPVSTNNQTRDDTEYPQMRFSV